MTLSAGMISPLKFEYFKNLLDKIPIRTIGETGVLNGGMARAMCEYVLTSQKTNLKYYGYDYFELVLDYSPNVVEYGDYNKAFKRLSKLQKKYKDRFEFNLIKGYTVNTLTENMIFDFVFIDGGHQYENVLHDWLHVKNSKIIVFDDTHKPPVKNVISKYVNPYHDVIYTDHHQPCAVIYNF